MAGLVKAIKALERRHPWFAEVTKKLKLRRLRNRWWLEPKYQIISFFWRRAVKALFGSPDAILHDTKIGKMLFDPLDWYGYWHMFRASPDSIWHSELLDLLKALLTDKKPTLLCVGAHVGTLVIPLAEHCKRLVAIEANPFIYKLLRANIAINQKDNIRTHNLAAWHERDTVDFLASRRDGIGAHVLSKEAPQRANPEVVRVPAVRLDDLLRDEDFDLVIMDIEGAETNALRGARRVMKNVQIFAVEFVPGHFRQRDILSIADFAAEVGKHFRFLYSPVWGIKASNGEFAQVLQHMYDGELSDHGLIFTKRELPAEVLEPPRQT